MKLLTKNLVEEIIKDLKAGVFHKTLVSKYDCLMRTISNIRKKYDEKIKK